jgi:hypothetical protein
MNQPPPWEDVAEFFEADGSLRDIYVLGSGAEHWDRLLAGLGGAPIDAEFFVDNDVRPLPRSFQAAAALHNVGAPRLEIEIGAIQALCFFFTPEEIEFSFDPRDLRDEHDLYALYDFMSWIGDETQLPVHLTPENGRQHPFLTYNPDGQTWNLAEDGQHLD